MTLTDAAMTRFIMTLEEAVRLVMESVFLARGGEVFVTKMPAIRIADLAEVLIEEIGPHYGYDASDIEIIIIGTKPGEKQYEELVNEEEVRRTVELERYFVVTPAFKSVFNTAPTDYPSLVNPGRALAYNSANQDVMTKEDLRSFLRTRGLLNVDDQQLISPAATVADDWKSM